MSSSVSGEGLRDEGSKLQVVTAGATAGLISRFIVAPFDVVKIRLQLQSHSLSDPLSHPKAQGGPIYKGTLPTLRHIVRNEGITGLWKGNVPAEIMYLCYGAVQFTAYRSVTQLLRTVTATADGERSRIPPAVGSFIAGAAAGAAATTTTYPLDLLRTRFAAQGNDRVYTTLAGAVRDIRRDEGWRGFFRGLGPGVGQIVPYMGIFFASYETLRLPLAELHLPWGGGDATAGVVSGVVAKTAVFPLDLVRKRIQVQGPTRARYVHKNIPEYYGGAVGVLRAIVRAEGFRGLYRGLTVSLIKAAPGSAVTVWSYERVLRLLMSMERVATEDARI
ncbi:mitochondrial deoxynucleotide carrier [Sodiomyces alkalinus F11]|uniref:Mitochondrial thiamine pyrophosphate carrier 1 n=1 Tax=Sodiomyces alkalinus (strain CBS 110278 / VKM F-3762 / F11) TaxID=1314773 RepID=A0A3N2PQL4_SODAK|nr:mitochondrial deoxynucleotide carrier [Sodiomyces alkalinus F11]ROT36802.1 mitochondrial deoxynucleotide carrier [Sodiomyces alkalinus F11]